MASKKPSMADIANPTIIKKYLTNGQYRTEIHPKKAVYLHHTAGASALSAWDWWNSTPERVGVPYIIERDGKIYECFDPRMWAPHLGVKGHQELDMSSIGIEIVAFGQLKKKNGLYYAYPGNYDKVVIPKEEVIEVDWRGEQYYQNYTKEQITSLLKLLAYLKIKFPSLTLQKSMKGFNEYNSSVVEQNLPGLWSHTTVRKDKVDVIPQPDLIEAINMARNILFT